MYYNYCVKYLIAKKNYAFTVTALSDFALLTVVIPIATPATIKNATPLLIGKWVEGGVGFVGGQYGCLSCAVALAEINTVIAMITKKSFFFMDIDFTV
ncbi:hypothetical protein HDF18_04600 [Mucilaginibacter sp. X5P1]|uniref:hypothetical protein n=1 Tax=Mucilaginibacter sp. X5P1 TaxID=2723088 RepID=UPI00161275A3|nr:hypothetical protein [Mucilaginibacter sp. X5P1]MBB6136901.1 type 1 glutamine amidotransferase [Mucilaginibacter sp. X5P1]